MVAQFEKENKMKKIIIVLCLSLLADSLMGQSKKRLSVFTEDSGVFLEELSDLPVNINIRGW